MASLKDQAIVLRRLDYSENSQVLAVFTRGHGKVRVIAKGVKRSTRTRFAVPMDLLDIGHVVMYARGVRSEQLAILSEWVQSRAHPGLRERLDRLYGAQYAAAITSELTEDWDPHPLLYDALAALLEVIDAADAPLAPIVRYQRGLLNEIGSLPILDACVGCKKPLPPQGRLHFSSFEGGLICRDCEPARVEKLEVPRRALRWLEGAESDPAGLVPAYLTFDYHLTHLLGRKLPVGESFLQACRQTQNAAPKTQNAEGRAQNKEKR